MWVLPREIFYGGGEPSPFEIWRVDLWSTETSRLYANRLAEFHVDDYLLSPDKSHLAFIASERMIGTAYIARRCALRIMRTDGSELRTLRESTKEAEEFIAPHWSPDGARLAYVRYFRGVAGKVQGQTPSLHLLDVTTGRDQVLAEVGGSFDWSPDGKRMAITSGEPRGVDVLELDTGRRRELWQDDGLYFHQLTWDPSGSQIAVTITGEGARQSEWGLYIVNVSTGERRKLVKGDIRNVSWSPDDTKLIYLDYTENGIYGRLWLLDLATGIPIKLSDQNVKLGNASWSKNSDALLLAVEEKQNWSYWIAIMTLKDRTIYKLALTESQFPQPTW